MMTCQEALESLHAYLDRELTEAEQHQVESHLAMCPDCSSIFHFESGILHFIGDRCRSIQAPATLHQRVRVLVHTVTVRKSAT